MIEEKIQIAQLGPFLPDVDTTKFDARFLYKSLQNRITQTKSETSQAYYALLKENKKEETQLLDSFHNNHSEFFRNPLTFSVLEKIVLPAIIQKKKGSKHKEIRVWSAACAAGQEAYSLAMMLEEVLENEVIHIGYRIFATDQCELQIAEAQTGKYDRSSLNNVSLKRFKHWFTTKGESCFIKPSLKKNIEFSAFDLFNETLRSPANSIFGDFDMIMCANLLFYYKPEYQKVILTKASNCLAKGGVLITGEIERSILTKNNFNEVYPHSAIFKK